MKKEYMGVPLEGFGEVVRKAAAEGMVLLKEMPVSLELAKKARETSNKPW